MDRTKSKEVSSDRLAIDPKILNSNQSKKTGHLTARDFRPTSH